MASSGAAGSDAGAGAGVHPAAPAAAATAPLEADVSMEDVAVGLPHHPMRGFFLVNFWADHFWGQVGDDENDGGDADSAMGEVRTLPPARPLSQSNYVSARTFGC